MRIVFIALAASILLFSCKQKEQTTGKPADTVTAVMDSTLVTDSTWGPINANTTIDSLKAIYGAENIKDERVCGPECADSIDVTFIYRDSPRQITVNWMDSFYHKKISFLETWDSASPYHTDKNIKAGSTMRELVKLNGKKISFSGFGWDYGGFVQEFHGGTLDKSNIGYRLDMKEWNGADSLVGDIGLDTDMPVVQRALDNIIVYYISLTLHRPVYNEY